MLAGAALIRRLDRGWRPCFQEAASHGCGQETPVHLTGLRQYPSDSHTASPPQDLTGPMGQPCLASEETAPEGEYWGRGGSQRGPGRSRRLPAKCHHQSPSSSVKQGPSPGSQSARVLQTRDVGKSLARTQSSQRAAPSLPQMLEAPTHPHGTLLTGRGPDGLLPSVNGNQ